MGNLKTEVSKAHTGEEVKEKISDTINEAGMVLDDEELDNVSGGAKFGFAPNPPR